MDLNAIEESKKRELAEKLLLEGGRNFEHIRRNFVDSNGEIDYANLVYFISELSKESAFNRKKKYDELIGEVGIEIKSSENPTDSEKHKLFADFSLFLNQFKKEYYDPSREPINNPLNADPEFRITEPEDKPGFWSKMGNSISYASSSVSGMYGGFKDRFRKKPASNDLGPVEHTLNGERIIDVDYKEIGLKRYVPDFIRDLKMPSIDTSGLVTKLSDGATIIGRDAKRHPVRYGGVAALSLAAGITYFTDVNKQVASLFYGNEPLMNVTLTDEEIGPVGEKDLIDVVIENNPQIRGIEEKLGGKVVASSSLSQDPNPDRIVSNSDNGSAVTHYESTANGSTTPKPVQTVKPIPEKPSEADLYFDKLEGIITAFKTMEGCPSQSKFDEIISGALKYDGGQKYRTDIVGTMINNNCDVIISYGQLKISLSKVEDPVYLATQFKKHLGDEKSSQIVRDFIPVN